MSDSTIEEDNNKILSFDKARMIFVFGSNQAGRHGAGAARFARLYKGAIPGQGYGLQGRAFAIPTMDRSIHPLELVAINTWINCFLEYARENPTQLFQVTCLGCGLGGQKHQDIAPMFKDAPSNCYFDEQWKPWLPNAKFWGTF